MNSTRFLTRLANLIEPVDEDVELSRQIVIARAKKQCLAVAVKAIHELTTDTGMDLESAVRYCCTELDGLPDHALRMEALATWTGDLTQIRVLKGKGAA